MADLRPIPPDFRAGDRYVSASALNQILHAVLSQIKGDGTTLLSKYFGNRLTLSAVQDPQRGGVSVPLSVSDSYNFTIATTLTQSMTPDATTMVVDQSAGSQFLNFPNDNGFLIAVNPDGSPLMEDDEAYELLMVIGGAGTANWTVIRGINGVQLPLTAGFTLTYFLPNATSFCTALTFLDGILTFDQGQQAMQYRSPATTIILTSTTKTAGYMAGFSADYNPVTRMWSIGEDVGLLADGMTTGYVVGQHYNGVFVGYDQGVKIYSLDNFAGGGGGGGGGTGGPLQQFSGNTTSAFVTIFNTVNSGALGGVFSLRNVDPGTLTTIYLNYRITVTDSRGNTSVQTANLPSNHAIYLTADSVFGSTSGGQIALYSSGGAIGNIWPPFSGIKLELQTNAANPGSPVPYQVDSTLG